MSSTDPWSGWDKPPIPDIGPIRSNWSLGSTTQVVTAPRFEVNIIHWSWGLGFSELAGFASAMESQEYSYNGRLGNVHTKQLGRPRPPQLVLRRALDAKGFQKMLQWHLLARSNIPMGAKMPAQFTIMDKGGQPQMVFTLENAWCSKLEIDPAKAGESPVLMMRVTIECDSFLPI